MTTALVDRVRVAFTTDPFSGSPSWTDITADVQLYSGITVTRGKGDRYGTIQPGTISLTVDNPTGNYTPNYASGSNYPNVVIGKRLQWHMSIDNGVTWFPRFDGFIDTYQTSWDNATGSWASCVIQATDRTKFLARQTLTDPLVQTYWKHDNPTDYWTLADPVGTVTPKNETGSTILGPFATSDAITYGQPGPPNNEGLTAVQTGPGQLKARRTNQAYSSAWAFEAFVQCTTPGVDFTPILLFDATQSHYIAIDIWGGSTGEAVLDLNDPTVGSHTLTGLPASQARVDDGNWHHIAVQYDSATSSGTLWLYVDGDLITFATAVGTITTPYYLWSIASNENGGPVQQEYVQAHTALYNTGLSAATIYDHAHAGLDGFRGDSAQFRAARIAAHLAGITTTNVGTSGTQDMSAWNGAAGKSIDHLLQDIQATENGAIYFGVDGSLKVVGRRYFDNLAASIVLPTDSYEADLSHVTDDSQLINDVTATGESGVPQEAVNATLAYLGTVNVDVTLLTIDDTEAFGYAQRRLVDGTPSPRFGTVSLDLLTMIPITSPYNGVTIILAFWGSDIGSVLQCTGLPTGSAPTTSMTQQIQGYAETRTHESYGVKFNTTPTFASVFQFDDATLGKFDTGGVLAY